MILCKCVCARVIECACVFCPFWLFVGHLCIHSVQFDDYYYFFFHFRFVYIVVECEFVVVVDGFRAGKIWQEIK